MSKVPFQFGLHAILSRPRIGYLPMAKLLVEAMVPFIQLRCEELSEQDKHILAAKIRDITQGSLSRFIVHDDPQLAVDIKADGVHLSRKKMKYNEARHRLGTDAIIGVPVRNEADLRASLIEQPDYVGIGPVFSVPENSDMPLGFGKLADMLAKVACPAFALGGLETDHLQTLMSSGAKNVSIIRQLNDAPNPHKILDEIQSVFDWTPRAK